MLELMCQCMMLITKTNLSNKYKSVRKIEKIANIVQNAHINIGFRERERALCHLFTLKYRLLIELIWFHRKKI